MLQKAVDRIYTITIHSKDAPKSMSFHILSYNHRDPTNPSCNVSWFSEKTHRIRGPRLDAFQLQELLIHRTALVVLEQVKATIADAFLLVKAEKAWHVKNAPTVLCMYDYNL